SGPFCPATARPSPPWRAGSTRGGARPRTAPSPGPRTPLPRSCSPSAASRDDHRDGRPGPAPAGIDRDRPRSAGAHATIAPADPPRPGRPAPPRSEPPPCPVRPEHHGLHLSPWPVGGAPTDQLPIVLVTYIG